MAISSKEIIYFEILHLDPMGQGVYKEGEKIYFIPKTLPGEKGKGEIIKSTKNINFVKVLEITTPSKDRTTSPCKHYKECSGCHYLHTSYENEKEFKISSYKKIFKNFIGSEKVHYITNDKRLSYRNRIQFHYDSLKKTYGYHRFKSNNLLPITDCLLPNENIKNILRTIKLPKTPSKGHFEVYEKDQNISITFNENYAHGGFTQVNSEVNDLMIKYVQEILEEKKINKALDLFGGEGNLSKFLENKVIVDLYKDKKTLPYLCLDLFKDEALPLFQEKNLGFFDLMIVDPPRSGFLNLNSWIKAIKPNYLLYISCHPQTQARDLENLKEYKITHFALIDLFPSTFHFESLIFLEKI